MVERHHGLAGNFQHIGMFVDIGDEIDLVPARACRNALIVEAIAGARAGEASGRGRRAPPLRFGARSAVNSSRLAPVASRTMAMDSVDGQRKCPSAVCRLLKVVASRPALRARPDAVSA